VDKNILSQCNTQIIMRVTNPNDLKALSKGLEGMTGELEEEIKRLPAGTAMLVSNEIERPVLVNVRSRKSRHGGVSTQIVSRDMESPAAKPRDRDAKLHSSRAPSRAPPSPAGGEKSRGGILKKVFGPRRA